MSASLRDDAIVLLLSFAHVNRVLEWVVPALLVRTPKYPKYLVLTGHSFGNTTA